MLRDAQFDQSKMMRDALMPTFFSSASDDDEQETHNNNNKAFDNLSAMIEVGAMAESSPATPLLPATPDFLEELSLAREADTMGFMIGYQSPTREERQPPSTATASTSQMSDKESDRCGETPKGSKTNGSIALRADNGEVFWEIEKILGRRVKKSRKSYRGKPVYEYQLKWKDWPHDDKAWYPEDNLTQHAVDEYERLLAQKEADNSAVSNVEPKRKQRRKHSARKREQPYTPQTDNHSDLLVNRPRANDHNARNSSGPSRKHSSSKTARPCATATKAVRAEKSNQTEFRFDDDGDNGSSSLDVETITDYRQENGKDEFRIKRYGHEETDSTWYGMESFVGDDAVKEAQAFKSKKLQEKNARKRRHPSLAAEPTGPTGTEQSPRAASSFFDYRLSSQTLKQTMLSCSQCPVCSKNFFADIESKHCPYMSQGCGHSICFSCWYKAKEERSEGAAEWFPCPVRNCNSEKAFLATKLPAPNLALMTTLACIDKLVNARSQKL